MTTLELSPPLVSGSEALQQRHARVALATKYALDRVLAAVLLITLLVPLLLLALLVASTSRGGVFFRHTRYGRNGRPFRMWKFRTMVSGADALLPSANEADGLLFKVRDDPRVTRVGRHLRKWSLDELPQLVNVLCGDMSLVGPRPLPVHPSSYSKLEARRLAVRPGITGLWQVAGRSDLSWANCVQLDVRYVESWSLWLDVRILARTVRAVVRRAGAY